MRDQHSDHTRVEDKVQHGLPAMQAALQLRRHEMNINQVLHIRLALQWDAKHAPHSAVRAIRSHNILAVYSLRSALAQHTKKSMQSSPCILRHYSRRLVRSRLRLDLHVLQGKQQVPR